MNPTTKHILPKLPYVYDALEPYIDALTMETHHTKHHQAYVDNLNQALDGHESLAKLNIVELCRQINKVPSKIRMKVRNNGGGHANHSLFWEIISPKKTAAPKGKLGEAIKSVFGGFDQFKEAFAAEAMGRFGSGWAWLTVEKGKLHVCSSPNQDNPWMQGNTPVLGLDVWEHAYYLKYRNKRAEYVDAFWNIVNWEKVNTLYLKSSKNK